MDLQTQLETTTERNWNQEKMELLERFDNERKEWECQWKVMQKKIEELYQEVKLRRESNMNAFENKSIHLKAPQWSQSPTSELGDRPGLSPCSLGKEDLLPKADQESKDLRSQRRNHASIKDHPAFENYKETKDGPSKKTTKNYTQDLNTALKELAKVSEDLCSYQEEIRKKSDHRRKKHSPFLEESVGNENILITMREVNFLPNNDPQLASIPSETERHNNRKNLMGASRDLKDVPFNALAGVEKANLLPWQAREAPPIPPRSTSWHLTSSLAHVSEAFAKETGQKSSSMTPEHWDGSAFIHSSFAKPCDVPVSVALSNGPTTPVTVPMEERGLSLEGKPLTGFCHNTWTCDTGKVGNCPTNGSSSHSVQKSCSDGNMVPQKHNPKWQNTDLYGPVCDTLGDSGYGTGKTQRNETLEAKIAEFNRTVFQTDKAQKSLQQNQMQTVSSPEPKSHCMLQGGTVSRIENDESACVLNPRLSPRAEEKLGKAGKNVRPKEQPKQLNGLLSGYHHMLQEHAWRPSNLSGRPRSADSRSNYGVVEKLLKNYERSAALWNSKFQKQQWVQSKCEFTESDCEKLDHCFEMLQTDQGKPEQQKNLVRHVGLYAKHVKEKQKFPEVSMPAKQSNGKGFSRPARPANRRLPSRWASRSPSAPPTVRRTALNELS
ncbi:hypothetical protein JRQ81_007803 [Phrynocephalus forsythii]|uniref:SOGA 1/2-like coiled-coil domain-containing protein n=1 Tax=Phrynocephalus forsythii TaxID=171643 RepID=A0A9Q0Y3W8_9SAUR|nr:hypothetical protein JRQ81_007803 [Phrynocephalus forsythii]